MRIKCYTQNIKEVLCFTICLEEENKWKWNGKNIIFKDYSMNSFSFGSLTNWKWIEHIFHSFSSNAQFLISPNLGGLGGNEICC